ncbi:hypothetical protein D3C85_1590870 [compost metagenome]
MLGAVPPSLVAGEYLTLFDFDCARRCGKGAAYGADEIFLSGRSLHQVFELLDFRQIHRHDRFASAQIFVDFDRVGGQCQRDDLKREQAHVEAVQVLW